jgi:predicted nucleic acid-binding protein
VTDPQSEPFIFDTSALSHLAQTQDAAEEEWREAYSSVFPVHVSVITVLERVRGYRLAEERADSARREVIARRTAEYLRSLQSAGTIVLDFTTRAAAFSAQLMALLPSPPSPPQHSHSARESRQDRLSRWRFDIMIASTALVHRLPLIHNNPQDFEPLHALIERMPERFPGVGPLNLISVKRLAA